MSYPRSPSSTCPCPVATTQSRLYSGEEKCEATIDVRDVTVSGSKRIVPPPAG